MVILSKVTIELHKQKRQHQQNLITLPENHAAWQHLDGESFGRTPRASEASLHTHFHTIHHQHAASLATLAQPAGDVTRAAARAAPNTKKIWLIPEAVPLAINITGVGCLLLGAAAYISSREPFFFLDKDKRRYGDAVYSQYPMPAPKPMSRNQEHAA
jgi:hypothetical protein